MQSLGRDYIVWDKAAEIEFVTPGRGKVIAGFRLDPDLVAAIRNATARGDRHLEWFGSAISTNDGSVVARVRKQLQVRRKHRHDNLPDPA